MKHDAHSRLIERKRYNIRSSICQEGEKMTLLPFNEAILLISFSAAVKAGT